MIIKFKLEQFEIRKENKDSNQDLRSFFFLPNSDMNPKQITKKKPEPDKGSEMHRILAIKNPLDPPDPDPQPCSRYRL